VSVLQSPVVCVCTHLCICISTCVSTCMVQGAVGGTQAAQGRCNTGWAAHGATHHRRWGAALLRCLCCSRATPPHSWQPQRLLLLPFCPAPCFTAHTGASPSQLRAQSPPTP
jgi:hypothetical protein